MYIVPATVKRDQYGLPIPPNGGSLFKVIERIADGKPVAEACEAEGIKPMLFYHWQSQDAALKAAAQTAYEISAENDVDRCAAIAEKINNENWQAERVRMQFYQWRAGKRFARLYGDKQAPAANVEVNVNIADAIREATARREQARISEPVVEYTSTTKRSSRKSKG